MRLLWECYCRRRRRLVYGVPNTTAATVTAAAVTAYHDLSEKGVEAAASALTCRVCLERFEECDVRRLLRCSHIFHPHCIDAWMKEGSNTCPLCRAAFLPQQPP
ncbi:hypothetical protein ACLOJK_038980 [Asimina triloba]